MSIWQDSNGGLHDDMDGAALSLPSWPASGLTLLTDVQVAAVRAAQQAAPAPTADSVRAQRDTLVSATDWLVQRHRDQIEAGSATTLTAEQYAALQTYRSALRNVPEQSGFPATVTWPTYPL